MKKLALLICLFAFQNLLSQEIDWSNPETIDPLKNYSEEYPRFDIDYYKKLALDAYKWTRYKNAAQYYLSILHYYPNDKLSMYNLACCYGQMKQPELAVNYLTRAVDVGFNEYEQILKEKDFSKIKDDELFKLLLERISALKKGREDIIYVKTQKLVKSRIYLPDKYNPKKSYQLLIGLHGNGGSSESFGLLWQIVKEHDFIFVVPEGAYPKKYISGSNLSNYSWEIQVRDKEIWRRGDPLTVYYIMEIVNYVSDNYKIKNVYLMGHSQGAAYAYITGIRHPDIFKGIICFAGILPETDTSYAVLSEEDIKAAKRLEVFIGHGENDMALDYDTGVKIKNKLENLGYRVTFAEHNNGHSIPVTAFNKALEWMKK
ncbi:MAG: hypothetical protein KAR38_00570 [Calditrichia bacterium]|nr:hypothetical protein [Calditrichia bacterium]